MTMSINRRILGAVSAVALGAMPVASQAALPGLGEAIACAVKSPIQLELVEIATQLGLVFPAQVLSPPGAPPAVPGAGRSTVMVANLSIGDRQVGTMVGSCITVGNSVIAPGEPAGDIEMCNQTFNLWNLPPPYDKLKGRIVVNGPVNRQSFHGSPDVTGDGVEQIIPVVGGTGAFSAARGQLRVRESDFNEHIQVWNLSGLLCL